MPNVQLVTNVELSKEQHKALTVDLSETSAKVLGKPPSLFVVNIRQGEVLSFGGTFDPCMYIRLRWCSVILELKDNITYMDTLVAGFTLTITSLNIYSPEANVKFAAGFTQWLEEKLGVSSDRGYITFYDPCKPQRVPFTMIQGTELTFDYQLTTTSDSRVPL